MDTLLLILIKYGVLTPIQCYRNDCYYNYYFAYHNTSCITAVQMMYLCSFLIFHLQEDLVNIFASC